MWECFLWIFALVRDVPGLHLGGTPPPPIVYVFFTDLDGNAGFKALARSLLGIDGLGIFLISKNGPDSRLRRLLSMFGVVRGYVKDCLRLE